MFRRQIETFTGFIDQFGGYITFSVQNNQKTYKTVLGAASSVVIYILGILYFLYLLALYFNNEIPPNVSQFSRFIEEEYSYRFQTPILAYNIYFPDFQPDPSLVYFSAQVYLIRNDSTLVTNQTIQTTGCEKLLPEGYTVTGCVDQNYNLSINLSQPGSEYYQLIQVYKCQEIFLRDGQRCASQSQIDHFIQIGYLQIIVFLKEYDYKTMKIRDVAKYYYYYLKQDDGYVFKIQLSDVNIDFGWLLQDFQSKTLITGADISPLSFNGTEMITVDYPFMPITMIEIDLNPQLQYVTIQFPKIGTILAQFQSVFSIVLIFGLAFQYHAERSGNLMITRKLIHRLFPSATLNQVEQLLINKDPKNYFYYQNLIRLKSIEEVLKQILEIRMIITLFLSSDHVETLTKLGLNYEDYIKFLGQHQNKILENPQTLEEKQMGSGKKSEQISIISSPRDHEKFESQENSQNYLNKYLMKQFTWINVNESSTNTQIGDNIGIEIFNERFKSSQT